MRNLIEWIKSKISKKEVLVVSDTSKDCINFAIWVQDNYSQNKTPNTFDMLSKGKMRKDFTNEVYTIDEIWIHYIFR